MKKMINLLPFLILAYLLTLASPAFAAEWNIHQKNFRFEANGKVVDKLTVKVGDTLTFKNEDEETHNVFSDVHLSPIDLGQVETGHSVFFIAREPGVMEVQCAFHMQMFLDVTVVP